LITRLFIAAAVLGLLSAGTLRAQSPGAAIFSSNCSGCHGADGRGGEHAPNIATAPEVQHLADTDIANIIKHGISGAGMPAFSFFKQQQVDDVVGYLRLLQGRGEAVQLPGDPRQGETLYFGKARCADCHMVNGKGGFIGSDLSFYADGVKLDLMRAVLLDPEKVLPADKKATTVVTNTGQTITGMLKGNDNFSLTLQTLDGAFHFLNKQDVARVELGALSLMPAATGLNSKEMDDLISYLIHAADENTKRSPGRKEKSDDDDN
jgi:cytochrome c oxidase cbb3-type subunit III